MKTNKTIYGIAWFFILLFLILFATLTWFTTTQKNKIATHPYNRRLNRLENEVTRGSIYDETGICLAENQNDKRYYPFNHLYSHAIGYSQRGRYGVEAQANVALLYPDYTIKSLFRHGFLGIPFRGHDVYTTLNHTLQEAVAKSFNRRKGAIVVMEPETGKIKVMYSSPTFNPNEVANKWDDLITNEKDSPLVNRVTQGLYPPASTFKIITTLAYMREKEEDFTYFCRGSITKNNHTIACYNGTAHQEVNLEEAFIKSCNTYFIALADQVSPKALQHTGEDLLFNKPLSYELDVKSSRLNLEDDMNFDTLASYIGQGKVLVTPYHMAVIASIIANDGVLMEPYLIDYGLDQKGNKSFKHLPNYKGAYLSEEEAKALQVLMEEVVKRGTATALNRKNLTVAGKTGTAQNETGVDHSWFVGYAKDKEGKQPPISFAVIVEQGGRGAQALEIINVLLTHYFN